MDPIFVLPPGVTNWMTEGALYRLCWWKHLAGNSAELANHTDSNSYNTHPMHVTHLREVAHASYDAPQHSDQLYHAELAVVRLKKRFNKLARNSVNVIIRHRDFLTYHIHQSRCNSESVILPRVESRVYTTLFLALHGSPSLECINIFQNWKLHKYDTVLNPSCVTIFRIFK